MTARPAQLMVASSLGLALAAPPFAQVADTPTLTDAQLSTWHRILAAEDARVAGHTQLDELGAIVRSKNQLEARLAARALGRSGRPGQCDTLVDALKVVDRAVLSTVLTAVATCYGIRPNNGVGQVLFDWAQHAPAQGSAALSIGRLTYSSESSFRSAERLLVDLVRDERSRTPRESRPAESAQADTDLMVDVLTGLESLERRHAKLAAPSPEVVELAERVVRSRDPEGQVARVDPRRALARRLGLQVLLTSRRVAPAVADAALADPDVQLRRLAALAVAREQPLRKDAWARLLQDRSGLVRHAALAEFGRRSDGRARDRCDTLLDLTRDADPHVALLAIDLAATCTGNARGVSLLTAEVDRRRPPAASGGRDQWHRAAHGLVSLATLSPERAAPAIRRLADDPTWQVRRYAARAAGVAGQADTLARLARDLNDNVREAAITALRTTAGHEADAVYLETLVRGDYQLIITAAQALEGTPERDAARDALLAALDRVTRQRRETSRDARRALLERLAECGRPSDAGRLQPYLSDFDDVIANQAASILTAWTGQPRVATPRPLPRLPLPTPGELGRLLGTRVVVHMRDLGRIELRMLADEAPLNAFRFVRLAAQGYYDGLTFHRVVPGFVIQGGSPGANEYMGDGPFTRDEIGAANRRGTVGLSTRGRDTGDAQFYVNLVDNYRLDEDYTVFAEVVRGMDVVDRILEGDVIDRVEVVHR